MKSCPLGCPVVVFRFQLILFVALARANAYILTVCGPTSIKNAQATKHYSIRNLHVSTVPTYSYYMYIHIPLD
ncbi:hypothetical protein M434DRAFT_198303 [Hypoxylon sp. CO27-5]|nr:hypothetical protein M434DRAFT_198303 [Hypoxylon sp. CO27-5]